MSFLNFQNDLPGSTIDESAFYIGTVVDNNDPLKIGRVRVRVPHLLPEDNIPDDHCPWAVMRRTGGWGSALDRSEFSVPEKNAKVLVRFVDGCIYSPVYETAPVDLQTKISVMETNYPNRYGWRDTDGSVFVVDKLAHTAEYEHQSGLKITVAPDGSITIQSPKDITFVGAQNSTVNLGGDRTEVLSGNDSLSVTKHKIETIGGNHTETTTGAITLTASGSIVIQGASITILPTTPGVSKVNLGSSSPTDFALLLAAYTKIKEAYDSHTHPGVMPGSGNTGTPVALPSPTAGVDYSQDTKIK